jgi:hypothetical protein
MQLTFSIDDNESQSDEGLALFMHSFSLIYIPL